MGVARPLTLHPCAQWLKLTSAPGYLPSEVGRSAADMISNYLMKTPSMVKAIVLCRLHPWRESNRVLITLRLSLEEVFAPKTVPLSYTSMSLV